MEILGENKIITPVRVGLKLLPRTVNGAAFVGVPKRNTDERF
jgi:hypothetical protein